LALILLLCAELACFCFSVQRQYAWIFPRWYDQDQYLMEGYNAYEVARTHGFAEGVAAAFGHESPQGAMHAFLSLLVYEAVGPSRLAALSLNLLGLAALQLASFCAAFRLSRSHAIGWAVVATLAALTCPWSGHWGSATDFRLDWMAACAFGVALCAGLMARGFRSTPWSFLFGVAVGLALIVRFLTAVYFCGILVLLVAWLLIEADRLRRCSRLLLSALTAAAIAAWPFWKCRKLIYNYYWVGHYGSPESAVRSTHQGALESLTWMAHEILFRQIGAGALCIGIGVLACLFLSRRREGGRAAGQGLRDTWVITAVFFAVPTLVLLTHPEKAEPPADIIGPAAMWLIFIGWISLSRGVDRRELLRTCSAAVAVGLLLFGFFQVRPAVSAEQVSDYRDVNALADFLYFRAQESGLARPVVSVTWMSDSLNADTFRILGYERHGKVVPFIQALPTSILEMPHDAVLGQIGRSDIVCVVTRAGAAWPIDRQMAAMAPELLRWCDANLVRDGSIETAEMAATVFERKNLGRPASSASLPATLALARSHPARDVLPPPASPFLTEGMPVLWAAATPLRYEIRMAYSPYELVAVRLPKGISLDPQTGILSGKFEGPGEFEVKLKATNAVGPSEVVLRFRVIGQDWTAEISPTRRFKAGEETFFDFSAFDATGTLDFIDITDLTESKVLARIEAAEDERTTWRGRYRFTLNKPGMHSIIARTVRFDAANATYTYVDRTFEVLVTP
jgi:hypothetical protein